MHIQCPRLPKLTQLQSRFAASLGASLLLIAIYFVLSSPRLAYAQELGSPSDAGQDTRPWLAERGPDDESTSSRPAWDGGPPIDPWDEELGAYVEDFGLPPTEEVLINDQAEHEVPCTRCGAKPEDVASEQAEEGKSELRKRQGTQALQDLPGNNSPGRSNITGGEIQRWIFSREDVNGPAGDAGSGLPGGFVDFEDQSTTYEERERHRKLREEEERRVKSKSKRQNQKTVYVAINTCSQPTWSGNGEQPDSPAQLTLFVSSSSAQVGAPNAPSDQIQVPLHEGFARINVTARGDVYIAIRSPTLGNGWRGSWTYSVAASIDNYYYAANDGLPPLYLVDTDTESALLVTDNLTQADAGSDEFNQWMDIRPLPFTVFAQGNNTRNNIAGMRLSYCGLTESADLQASQTNPDDASAPIQMSMVARGLGYKPKQQFVIRGLNGSSTYQAILAMYGNSSTIGDGVVGGGGKVWTATNFTTKSDGNCALLYNLTFCSSTAYSVPSNPFTFPNTTSLSTFYDTYAQDLYTNFSLSLQLIPCNTSSTARYSLSKTCDDCSRAYKEWLCAVTIPRCEDFSSPLPYLQSRNVAQAFIANDSFLPEAVLQQNYNPMWDAPSLSGASQQVLGGTFASNRSRNSRIDEEVRPGPYKELLPCEDLCFDLVRSCPSALGFACPAPGRGLEAGYGKRSEGVGVRCSFAGAVYQVAAAGRVGVGLRMVVGGLVLALSWILT
ncbi:stretch-activated Ca2+-permeable channel component-domain-containing protein [Elsinoe ampelina]|uniref:Stretch-activated Ca2+-permeable channel component-domain-containing protein n=1 Tax=Elsinoe ampelina TaxID=302913 RepID=A0A6A6G722_9PEZI|nr:stretch-activated Ca2+-permeable channel component-domain-containing protein [Elsinoe ampelina]